MYLVSIEMSDEQSDPSFSLKGKTIVLGVSGSIAAYKSADLISELRKSGADVFVVMTQSATRFISSLTLGTLSRNPVLSSLWEEEESWHPGHVEIADSADVLLVAPATANQIGNFANGCAPDALSSVYLATEAKVIIAPAMNGKMYLHSTTKENLTKLRSLDVSVVEPVVGELACGYEGIGKMASVEQIVDAVKAVISPNETN
jgi:phosphopantothenoylcysteine decarboxylase/phosphopantothenoylcysteine decarboxylase/phosphopantothenate--cysteine ligase